MALAWDEVTNNPEYKSLPPEDQALTANQYFDQVVAPQAGEHIEAARSQFSNYSGFQIGEAANQDSSFLGDTANEAMMGVTSTLSGISSLVGADAARDYYAEKTNKLRSGLSPEQQAADKEQITTKINDGSDWNPFNYDWEMPSFRKVTGIVAQALPGTAAGMGVGGVAAKGIGMAGNMIGQRAAMVAAAKGGDVAAKAALRGRIGYESAAGFAAGEGSIGAGMSGVQVHDAVMNLKPEVIGESPEYKKLIGSGLSPYDAQSKIADIAQNQAEWTAGTTTALLGGIAGKFFGSLFARGGKATADEFADHISRKMNATKGAGVEALQETGQSLAEQGAQNIAIKDHADPTQSTGEGVFENAAGGALAGGIMGGAVGAIAPVQQNPAEDPNVSPEELVGLYDEEKLTQDQMNQNDIQTQQTPEAYQDLNAQALAVHDGRKPAILVTDGAETPLSVEGLNAIPVEGYGTLYAKGKAKNGKIGSIPILNKDNSLNGQVLGYASSMKPADDSGMVTEGVDANGNIVHQEIGQSEDAAIAAQNIAGEGGQVRVIPVEQSLQEREQRRQEDLQQLQGEAPDAQTHRQNQQRLAVMQQQQEAQQQSQQQEAIAQAQDTISMYDDATSTGYKLKPNEIAAYEQAKRLLPDVNVAQPEIGTMSKADVEKDHVAQLEEQFKAQQEQQSQQAMHALPANHPYLDGTIAKEDVQVLAEAGNTEAQNALMIRRQLEASDEANKRTLSSNDFGAAEVKLVQPEVTRLKSGGIAIKNATEETKDTLRKNKVRFVINKKTLSIRVMSNRVNDALDVLGISLDAVVDGVAAQEKSDAFVKNQMVGLAQIAQSEQPRPPKALNAPVVVGQVVSPDSISKDFTEADKASADAKHGKRDKLGLNEVWGTKSGNAFTDRNP